LEQEDAKRRSAEETAKKEIDKLPEAYAETKNIPLVEVMIPVATLIIDASENIDFSQFELGEEEYTS
jgi:hypothetical protein